MQKAANSIFIQTSWQDRNEILYLLTSQVNADNRRNNSNEKKSSNMLETIKPFERSLANWHQVQLISETSVLSPSLPNFPTFSFRTKQAIWIIEQLKHWPEISVPTTVILMNNENTAGRNKFNKRI